MAGREPKKKASKQAQELAVNMQAMQDIQAIENQTKILQQESLNKSHDTELSPYSDVNGQNNDMPNLGVIGEDQVKKAFETLMKYRENKANLEERLNRQERFWKLAHWDVMHSDQGDVKEKTRIEPKSAWLVNTILNKHADAMDNFPEPNILPRSKDDVNVAKVLTQVIPTILEQNDYEQTYSDCAWDKNKTGTSVTGVFWNNDKNNGLGDIDIRPVDLMKLYWKSGVKDIQDSPNVFLIQIMDNDEIKAQYPGIDISGDELEASQYNYGESVDNSNSTAVIDWYYKRRIQSINKMGIPQMRTVVHYCKFCNGQVIYASENDPNYANTGWYAHGKYPFVFDVLYPVKASACGMGIIDLIADDQIYVDKLEQAILENAIAGARPRSAVRSDSGLNEEEYLDLEKPLVHFDGNLGEDAFRPIQSSPLSNIYETIRLQKIQEMKDTSGNTAASQGQTSNVTTASGIASLQEAAGKLSRDATQASYRAYKKIVELVIELIRQFYTEERCFRIIGEYGKADFVQFDNRELKAQSMGQIQGLDGQMIDLGSREPIMDIQVKPQKRSAYSKEGQNQTALQLYQMGFFAPNNADASLACLQMMEFDGVEDMREKVASNGTLFTRVMQLNMLLQQLLEGHPELQEKIGMNMQETAESGNANSKGVSTKASKGSLTTQAANATRESTAPRS